MDNSVYSHLLNKIKKSGTIPHHNFPSHNLLSVENLLEVSHNLKTEIAEEDALFLASFPCYHQFPYVVSKSCPCFCGSGATDEADELVKKKLKWQKELKCLKVPNVDTAMSKIKALRQNKEVKLSKSLQKYVNHFYHDPEPMFYGNYNWLYTNGTLNHFEQSDEVTLISADYFGKKPGFNILRLDKNLDEIQQRTSSSLLKTSSPVLQITCKSKEGNLIICVRQKNHVNLYSFDTCERLSQPVKLWRKKVLPPKLITCADLKTSCDEIVLSDSNHDLHVFNVEQKNKIYSCVGRKILPDLIRDPWSQVAFGDLGFYVAFRNCFVILDPRDMSSRALEYSPTPAVNNCEDICSFVKSSIDSNFIYLGMTHSVLQLDVRNGETVQKWTHLMRKPPQLMRGTKDGDGSEVLVLQSQDVDEVVGIVNGCATDGEKRNFVSRSLPCLLMSVKESLRMTRLQGVCLSPALARRIDFAMTGMECIQNKTGGINVFTNNSAGDVFVSKLHRRNQPPSSVAEDSRQALEAMKTYESQLQNFPLPEYTNLHLELVDMSHVVKDLRKSKSAPKKWKRSETCWKRQEMHSPESLEFCRDLLAQKILRVWGYGRTESELGSVEMSANEKVREWMYRN